MDIALTRSNKNCPNQLFFNIFNSIFLWPLRHIGRVLWATNMLRLGIPRKFSRYRSPVHTLTMPKDRLAAIYRGSKFQYAREPGALGHPQE